MTSAAVAVASSERVTSREQKVAIFALMVMVGTRSLVGLPGGLRLGDCLAIAILPLTWSAIRHSRVFTRLTLLCVTAAATGMVMSVLVDTSFRVFPAQRCSVLLGVIALPCVAAAVAWGARRIGLNAVAVAIGTSMLLDVLPQLGNPGAWKVGVVPAVTALVLALVANRGRAVQAVAPVVLGLLFVLNDARAASGFLLIVLLVVLWHGGPERVQAPSRHPHRQMALRLVAVVVTLALAAYGVILASSAGVLGEEAQKRTVAQSSETTGVLLAARPELGASWNLFLHRPWGYGAGVGPRYKDVRVAMEGMASLGYDPENNYVLHYMFGHGFELHSGIADMWTACSLPGALLVIVLVIMSLGVLLRDLGSARVHPWLVYAVLMVIMNAAVGPWVVLGPYLALTLGAAFVPAIPPLRPRYLLTSALSILAVSRAVERRVEHAPSPGQEAGAPGPTTQPAPEPARRRRAARQDPGPAA